ncbi:MAG: DUF2207 domain-containing protein [Erysipelotrichaceae bacterium]
MKYKGLRKYAAILMLMITLLFSNVNVMADVVDDAYYYDEIYVEYQVKDDNTFIVTETMNAVFNYEKHGITRTIPHSFKLERPDGSSTDVFGTIDNVHCNENYEVTNMGRDSVIKIGDPDKLVSGKQQYTLRYEVNIGKDKLVDLDEFYRNIIGTDYDTHTNKVKFKISMPKEFDNSKIGFSHGYKGTTGFDKQNLKYEVNGNVITGSYTNLKPYEGLTIRVELDEGYFSNAKDIGGLPLYYYALAIIFGILGILLVFILCRNPKPFAPIEFEAPEGYNSLDVALVSKLKLSSKDFFTMIVHLANLGYIEIEELDGKGKKKNFKLTKLKNYEGNISIERSFLNAIFTYKDAATLKEIGKKCSKQLSSLRSKYESENRKSILDPINLKVKLALFVLILLELGILYLANSMIFMYSISIGIFVAFGIFVCVMILFMGSESKRITDYLLTLMFFLIPTFVFIIDINSVAPYMSIFYTIVIIMILILSILITKCKKRKAVYNEVYGEILGFKEFLATAEKDRLETLVNDNPNYFYDMLPFAYVLGVSDEWVDNFANIDISNPGYYHGNDFARGFNDFSSSVSSNLHSVSSNSGSSGGSSSGGGGGGGGSSSW